MILVKYKIGMTFNSKFEVRQPKNDHNNAQSNHQNKDTYQEMTEGASPVAEVNKVLSEWTAAVKSSLFVLFPLRLYPITVFA